jgi:hypothetical protein
MQIPDDVAAELSQALAQARASVPKAWIKREGSRLDSAIAIQRLCSLATAAGLLPSPALGHRTVPATIHQFPSRDPATIHQFPSRDAAASPSSMPVVQPGEG